MANWRLSAIGFLLLAKTIQGDSGENGFTCRDSIKRIKKSQLCDGIADCSDNSDENEQTCADQNSIRYDPPECGIPTFSKLRPLVRQGEPAEFGEFPWHVAIYSRRQEEDAADDEEEDEWENICGGSLLSQKVVITAAHCIAKVDTTRHKIDRHPEDLQVAVGKYYRSYNHSTEKYAQYRAVEMVYTPPLYIDRYSLYYQDIGFLIVKEPFKYNLYVKPVCLEQHDVKTNRIPDGSLVDVTGWGRTENASSSEILLEARLPLVPRAECLKKIVVTQLPGVHRDKYCVGAQEGGRAVCSGDSGGGMVFYRKQTQRYYLHGIVSVGGKGCKGKKNEFSLFTSIAYYQELVDYAAAAQIFAKKKADSIIERVAMTECEMPPQPKNGFYNVSYHNASQEQHIARVETVTFDCSPGFFLVGESNFVKCEDGIWFPEIPICADKCPPLWSKVLLLRCFLPDSTHTSCREPMPNGSFVIFSCNPNTHEKVYNPEYTFVTCKNAYWDKELQNDFCREKFKLRKKTCLPLNSNKIIATSCIAENGTRVSCEGFQAYATKVEFKCGAAYKKISTNVDSVTCFNGEWTPRSPEHYCHPECGKTVSDPKDKDSEAFPWHVAIFQSDEGQQWKKICGGTIISPKVVATASDCLAQVHQREKVETSPEELLVVAGKYNKPHDHSHENHVQYRSVEMVYTPSLFLDTYFLGLRHIGFLILKDPFDYNHHIKPVCLETQDPNASQVQDGSAVDIIGRDTMGNKSKSEILQERKLIYASRKECLFSSSEKLYTLLMDKYCLGISTESVKSTCPGDTGSGVVFYWEQTHRYYLQGVISSIKRHKSSYTTRKDGSDCGGNGFSLVTSFGKYKMLLDYAANARRFTKSAADSMMEHMALQDCEMPPQPKNGHYNVSYGDSLQGNNIIRVKMLIFNCSPGFYLAGESNTVKCLRGAWIPEVPTCSVECGIETPDGPGKRKHYGPFPWHVAIYINISQHWINRCDGTVISPKAIITSINCVSHVERSVRTLIPVEELKVAAGKYYRAFDHPDDKHAQHLPVEMVYIPPLSRDSYSSFFNSLGMLFLQVSLEYNPYVRPICLETYNPMARQLPEGSLLQVSGWDRSSSSEERLLDVTLSLFSRKRCMELQTLSAYYVSVVTKDKYCALSDQNECSESIGGGVVFRKEKSHRYYLHGISSSVNFCSKSVISIFTNVSYYQALVNYAATTAKFEEKEANMRSIWYKSK